MGDLLFSQVGVQEHMYIVFQEPCGGERKRRGIRDGVPSTARLQCKKEDLKQVKMFSVNMGFIEKNRLNGSIPLTS